MFGLNQLLLPVICPKFPDFGWCANRHYLSGGSAHMVYTEFVVKTRSFGDYAACNPDPVTGTFQCEHYTNPNSFPPQQCAANYFTFDDDCLNGTVYKTIQLPKADGLNSSSSSSRDGGGGGVGGEGGEGGCCQACTDDGFEKCQGWNMPDTHGTVCELLTGPLVTWKNAQHLPGATCTSAMVFQGASGSTCWYDDEYYKKVRPLRGCLCTHLRVR